MKQRLADYVADFLVNNSITDVFSVVGGGAMHLNDAFGHHDGLKVTYNHHEQASAIAAEAYAHIDNRIAALCVTSGPGGVNALTGVMGGWLDSIPMVIISGQVRYDTSMRYYEQLVSGYPLRSLGEQEFNIVDTVATMTKYAVMVENPADIRYILEKALYRANSGRKGPVWIDIPVNFQGAFIETEDLVGYNPETEEKADKLPPKVSENTVEEILDKISKAERPILYVGGGVRLSGGYEAFRTMVELLNVPVVTFWNSIDLIEDVHSLYVGRGGTLGDRAGNFAVQNSDLILAIGTRLSIRQTGYNYETWARAAEVIMVDIDQAEMKKHTIHVDMPVWADALDFMTCMCESAIKHTTRRFQNQEWLDACQNWKQRYPVTLQRHWETEKDQVNVFAFMRYLSESLPENSLTAVSNGACSLVGHQSHVIKNGTRFIINDATGSMGYGLPAAIGVCVAENKKETFCLEGDGSIMMNLAELQTIVTNNLPVKVFIVNNQGYHSIRITQGNLFSHHSKVGIGKESNDLGFPSFEKIATAFDMPYYSACNNEEMKNVIDTVMDTPGYLICEVFTDTEQVWEPKSSARKLEDGSIVSPPLEDLAPFLPREELKSNMFIPLVEEDN